MKVTAAELMLVDRWQRDFPLVARPFATVGQAVGLDEAATIATFTRLYDRDVISRIGAVVRPNTIGTSMLVAMRVLPEMIDEVAAIVSSEPLVTHNYERDHAVNLWFVVSGPDAPSLATTLARIERRTKLSIIRLPLIESYHLDLGFTLTGEQRNRSPRRAIRYGPDSCDRRLLAAIEDGLPLVRRPYQDVGQLVGLSEEAIIERLSRLISAGIITRFGCVVRHRALGYIANAMAVWDVPDNIIDVVAARFTSNQHLTLCYQRPRDLPDWPYNLFCMIHAHTRPEALAVIDDLNAIAQAGHYPQAVLFSTRCFKQRGAVFSDRMRGH
jgi:DNA-binding Lrp family transcriptional regulator